MKPSVSLKNRLGLIFFGLVTALILAEILFRIAGVAGRVLIRAPAPLAGAYIILCLGDSTTYGLRASDAEHSYPRQLEKILGENNLGRNFQVINGGIPGLSSSEVLNGIKQNIEKYRPSVIVMMVGRNDSWNLSYVDGNQILKFYRAGFFQKKTLEAKILLQRSRLIRFLKLCYLAYRNKNRLHDGPPRMFQITPEMTLTLNESQRQLDGLAGEDPAFSAAIDYALAYNIESMVHYAADSGIPIVFMTYHVESDIPARINGIYRRLGLHPIDNTLIFHQAREEGLNLISKDNYHPNDDGYLVIARNVYNGLISRGLISGEPIDMLSDLKTSK